MTKRRLVKAAKEAYLHAGAYAFDGRRNKKGDMRRLWITRISHAVKLHGLSYSRFISGMKKSKIELDRKILAELILSDPAAFKEITRKVSPDM